MNRLAPLWLLIGLVLLVLFPFFFGELLTTSLSKLHLDPSQATLIAMSILVGGLVNIPVREIPHNPARTPGRPVFGIPLGPRATGTTIIAVNIGGCLIPVGLALYEISYLATRDFDAVVAVIAASALNAAVCYALARPVEGLGIAIPGFAPALVAVLSALILAPENAPPVAFCAGMLGPLIGADLFHLKDIAKAHPAIASIGGAGTFDGIVLSGIIAAYMA